MDTELKHHVRQCHARARARIAADMAGRKKRLEEVEAECLRDSDPLGRGPAADLAEKRRRLDAIEAECRTRPRPGRRRLLPEDHPDVRRCRAAIARMRVRSHSGRLAEVRYCGRLAGVR